MYGTNGEPERSIGIDLFLYLGIVGSSRRKKARLDEENGLDRARRRRDCFFYKYERSR